MVSTRWLRWNLRPEQRGKLIDWRGVPQALRSVATAVCRNPREAEDLVLFYGSADFQPAGGVVLLVPGQSPVYISHIRFQKPGRQEPVNLTARQLRDIAAESWWQILALVLDDPDQGRVMFDDWMRMSQALRWEKATRNRLARIVMQAQNKILHPDVQAWQEQKVISTR
jgi:hypothetical protein